MTPHEPAHHERHRDEKERGSPIIGTGAVLVEAKRQGLRPRRTTTLTHCLGMDGQHASQQHIGSLLDCAEICQTNANFVLRGSAFHARTCQVCAEICARCANERAATGDDPMMQPSVLI